MRLRMPRICRHGVSGWFATTSGCSLISRVAISPMVIRFNTTACCVRRSMRKSALLVIAPDNRAEFAGVTEGAAR